MKPKNYGKDISSVNTPVRFHLPDGSTQRFNNSQEAQAWFNENYSDGYSMIEYIPTQGDSDHPIQLPEVTVTAQAPKRSLSSPSRKGVDMWAGANYSPRFNKHFYGTSDFDALFGKSRVEGVKKAWQSNPQSMQNWTDGGNIAAAMIAAPFAAEAVGAAYSVPEIAGALNLYGAYEGLGRFTSKEGVAKTYNKFKSGDYLGGTKSLGGDVLDITMSLPFLNRVRQVVYNTAKPSILGYQMSRSIPNEYQLKGSQLIPEGKPFMSEFDFGKRSGYAVHADKGDHLGAFTGNGAYIEDGVLLPGQTRLSGQRNFTWWNEDKQFSPGFSFGKPYQRIIVSRKEDIPGLQRVREMNEPVGQWRPGRRSLVQKSELVTPEPTDLSSSLIYQLDPYEASLGHKVYARQDMPRMSMYSQEGFPFRDFSNPQQGVRTSGIHKQTTTGDITGSRNVDVLDNPGPITYHNSRVIQKETVEPSSMLRVTNAGKFYPIPRGAYHPEGINFTRDIQMELGFRPNIERTWTNPENGIKIFDWTSNHNWPIETPSNRWLSNKDSNWGWTDLVKQPITLWHKNGGKLKK